MCLTDRAWFTRAWTFQKVGLSSDAEVCCGSYRLPWKTMVYSWLFSMHTDIEKTIFQEV